MCLVRISVILISSAYLKYIGSIYKQTAYLHPNQHYIQDARIAVSWVSLNSAAYFTMGARKSGNIFPVISGY